MNSVKKYISGLRIVLAGFAVLLGTLSIVSTPVATATVAAATAAKCAILDQGRVNCPSYLGNLSAGTCWYEDPGDTQAGSKPAWHKIDCGNDIFKAAISPEVTPAEDPALTQCKGASSCDLVKKYVDPFIAVLVAGVGLAVTIGIVIGGIQYASSAGDPQRAAAAKSRITNAIIALLGLFLLYALLSWLLPGGLPT